MGIRNAAVVSLLLALATPFDARSLAVVAPLTDAERQRLIAHLEMTESWLADEVAVLSAAQLAFRPSADAWTILEVVEHLVMVGPVYWRDLQQAVKLPASAGRRNTWTDADILWYGIDRTQRDTATASETPTGKLRDLKTGLAQLRRAHAQLMQYVRTTNDELRNRIVARQGCDAYQWALMISTHEQRHILQIREIKASPAFPRK